MEVSEKSERKMIACPEAGPGDGLVAHAEGELQVF